MECSHFNKRLMSVQIISQLIKQIVYLIQIYKHKINLHPFPNNSLNYNKINHKNKPSK